MEESIRPLSLLASLVLRRLPPLRKLKFREEKAGFLPGRGYTGQNSAIRLLFEHRLVYQRPTIVVFEDIKTIFDSRQFSPMGPYAENRAAGEVRFIPKAPYRQSSSGVRLYTGNFPRSLLSPAVFGKDALSRSSSISQQAISPR